MAVAAVIGAVGAAGVYTANKAANQQKAAQDRALEEQKKANAQALETAKAEEERAEVAYNQANQQRPEVAAIVSRSQEAATQGAASTVLTGGNKDKLVATPPAVTGGDKGLKDKLTATTTAIDKIATAPAAVTGEGTVNPLAQAVAKGKSKKGGGRGDASGGSLLTGQIGVDPSLLSLGGNTLLGS